MSIILKDKNITLRANEFSVDDLTGTIFMVDEKERKLLVKLDNPLTIKGITYQMVIATPRLSKHAIVLLLNNKVLGCSVTWVPEKQYNPDNPFDLNWWRGGAAAIADIYLN
ncbi:MAG: hypothetical protein QM500_13720 [Methylococcales bacterium]